MHYEETLNKAADSLRAGGILDTLLELVLSMITDLLDGCNFSSEEMAAKLENPGLVVRMAVTNKVRNELFNAYGAGAWFRHDGPGVVRAILAVGKKATAADFAAMRGN